MCYLCDVILVAILKVKSLFAAQRAGCLQREPTIKRLPVGGTVSRGNVLSLVVVAEAVSARATIVFEGESSPLQCGERYNVCRCRVHYVLVAAGISTCIDNIRCGI